MDLVEYVLLHDTSPSLDVVFSNEPPIGRHGQAVDAQRVEATTYLRNTSSLEEGEPLPAYLAGVALMHRGHVAALQTMGVTNLECHEVRLLDLDTQKPVAHELVLANFLGTPSVSAALVRIVDDTGALVLDTEKLGGLLAFRPAEYPDVVLIAASFEAEAETRGLTGFSFDSPRSNRDLWDLAIPARLLEPEKHFERAVRHRDDAEAMAALERLDPLSPKEGRELLARVLDRPGLVRALVDRGADVGELMAEAQRDDVLDLLARAGGTLELGDAAVLEAAKRRGSHHRLRRMLAAGANADARTSNGESALSLAVRQGGARNVYVLLQAGAQVAHLRDYAGAVVSIESVEDPIGGMLRSAQGGAVLGPGAFLDRAALKEEFLKYAAAIEAFHPESPEEVIYAMGIDGGRVSLNSEAKFAKTLATYQAKYGQYRLASKQRDLRFSPGDWSYRAKADGAAPKATVRFQALEVLPEDLRTRGQVLGELLRENLAALTGHLRLADDVWVAGTIAHEH